MNRTRFKGVVGLLAYEARPVLPQLLRLADNLSAETRIKVVEVVECSTHSFTSTFCAQQFHVSLSLGGTKAAKRTCSAFMGNHDYRNANPIVVGKWVTGQVSAPAAKLGKTRRLHLACNCLALRSERTAGDTINPMDRLITVLAALITFVASVIHGDHRDPQIRSWDGTTLKMDWNGLSYQATCESGIGSAGGGGTEVCVK